MAARYTADTAGNIALVAATAKTVMNVISATTKGIRIVEFSVSFDGAAATAVPVVVELCKSTQATAGTSTAHTIVQIGGATRTVDGTAARNYTAEPTVLTTAKRWLVHPQGGLLVVQFPLGREPEQFASANGLCIRCTAPAAVNVQGYIEFENG